MGIILKDFLLTVDTGIENLLVRNPGNVFSFATLA
jgi:hypothetical protein